MDYNTCIESEKYKQYCLLESQYMRTITPKIPVSVLWMILITCFFLSGCQSTQSLENQWFGKTKEALLTAWGTPTRTEENPDGSTVYIYTKTYYPAYQETIGNPSNPVQSTAMRDGMDYPIQVKAESNTTKFWITPEGRIYRVEGRIFK